MKGKISIKMKPEAAFERMYGEISPNYASEKSLVFLNGKKLEYKLFNKSFSIYSDKYELYYIPKDYVSVFTNKPNIEDVFISFVK